MLTFRSGAWVIWLAVLLSAIAAGWRVSAVLTTKGQRAVGDGKNPASYGFDLDNSLIPRAEIVAAGIPKDGVRALWLPDVATPSEIGSVARKTHRKILLASDRVIGVTIGGRARAYPIRILNWHEVVNDTLGGRPIAVTYSPLCDAAVVFDRRVAGRELRFGVSGLLFNSNLIAYGRDLATDEETLFSQLLACGVAGPLAGQKLELVPARLLRWQDWQAMAPGTDVLAGLSTMGEEYKRNPYSSYFGSEKLRFPVHPLPGEEENLFLKSPVLVVRPFTPEERIYPLPILAQRVDPSGTLLEGGLRIFYRDAPPTAWAEDPSGGPVASIACFRFAWHAVSAARAAPR
jgi:hypothetical protein